MSRPARTRRLFTRFWAASPATRCLIPIRRRPKTPAISVRSRIPVPLPSSSLWVSSARSAFSMSWIKRNLYFFILSILGVVLMGLAGWFSYSKWNLNNEMLGSLNEDYDKLKNLNNQNPHPGSGQIDNIKTAKEQREQLRDFIRKSRSVFERIPAIPDEPKLSD